MPTGCSCDSKVHFMALLRSNVTLQGRYITPRPVTFYSLIVLLVNMSEASSIICRYIMTKNLLLFFIITGTHIHIYVKFSSDHSHFPPSQTCCRCYHLMWRENITIIHVIVLGLTLLSNHLSNQPKSRQSATMLLW